MRRGDEALRLPAAAPDGPFGEKPKPWYKLRGSETPKKYSTPVGIASTLIAAWAASGLHGATRILVGIAVLGLPSLALEAWWRARKRRENERLLPELDSA